MGRAIGIAGTFMAGVRVAGQLTYIPAYIKADGSKRSQRCIIPVYRNSNRGTNQKTGEKGRTDSFKLVAWGKLADVCARSLPQGTAIDVFAEPQSYLGTLFNRDGSPRYDNAGQVVQTTKVSFTILNIVFGEDSEKHIDQEIADGRRPQFWNVKGHQDYQTWKSMLQQKQQVTWTGGNEFQYARVVLPKDGQVDMSVYQGGGNRAAAPAAGYPNPGMAGGQFPNMVAQVANTFQPGAAPNAVNPNVTAPVAPNPAAGMNAHVQPGFAPQPTPQPSFQAGGGTGQPLY